MKKLTLLLFISIVLLLSCLSNKDVSKNPDIQKATNFNNQINNENMKLGAFSISLNVKDLQVSKAFYENLGFQKLAGDMKMNYLIMKNGNSLIGLFQGMFEGNIITFNPGWDENGKNIDPFDDVREIHQQLKDKEVKFESEVDPEKTSGPASFILKDPDGNVIFVDQHR